MPTVFTWTKKTATRPPPKQRADPVVKTSKVCSIGVLVHLHPENHVNTCTKDLITSTTEDKEFLIKPAIVSVSCNMDTATYCDASTNTPVVPLTSDSSTQTEELSVSHSEASTMTEQGDEQETIPFQFEPFSECDDDLFYIFGRCCI